MPEYRYRVDAKDLVTCVDEEWLRFAADNWRKDFHPGLVLKTSLWNYIHSPETVQIYRLVFDSCRRHGRSVRLPFRCDSPEIRRYMELFVESGISGALEFRSVLLKEEKRSPVPLTGSKEPPDYTLIRMCSWCKRIDASKMHGSGPLWIEPEDAVDEMGLFLGPVPRITHSVCDTCYSSIMTRIQAD